MGLFNVNIPLLYGEGTKAYQRLQQAIISRSDDDSVFAWLSSSGGDTSGMLAMSFKDFATTGNIRPIHFWPLSRHCMWTWSLTLGVVKMLSTYIRTPLEYGRTKCLRTPGRYGSAFFLSLRKSALSHLWSGLSMQLIESWVFRAPG